MAQRAQAGGMLVEMAGCGGALDPKQGERHDAAGRSPSPHCSHFGLTHWTGHLEKARESCLVSGPVIKKVIRPQTKEMTTADPGQFFCVFSVFFVVVVCTYLTAGVSC